MRVPLGRVPLPHPPTPLSDPPLINTRLMPTTLTLSSARLAAALVQVLLPGRGRSDPPGRDRRLIILKPGSSGVHGKALA
jgi:hypothetical protein